MYERCMHSLSVKDGWEDRNVCKCSCHADDGIGISFFVVFFFEKRHVLVHEASASVWSCTPPPSTEKKDARVDTSTRYARRVPVLVGRDSHVRTVPAFLVYTIFKPRACVCVFFTFGKGALAHTCPPGACSCAPDPPPPPPP